MRLMACGVGIVFVFLAGIIAGVVAPWSRQPTEGRQRGLSPEVFVSAALECAKADPERACLLLRGAIANMDHDPDQCSYVWNAIEQLNEQGDIRQTVAAVRSDYLAGLEGVILRSGTLDDIDRLLALRSIVTKAKPRPSVETRRGEASPVRGARVEEATNASAAENEGEVVILLREGLRAADTKDTDRAEALTQAALSCQQRSPKLAGALWKEYRANLVEQKGLTPYDRMARLSAYLENVNTAVLACRTKADFDAVWRVRSEVLSESVKVHSELSQELLREADGVLGEFRKQGADERALDRVDKFTLLAPAVEAKAQVWRSTRPATATEPDGTRAKLIAMLGEVVGMAEREASSLLKRYESEIAKEAKGNAPDPAEGPRTGGGAGAQVGQYEMLSEDAGRLHNALEKADFQVWLVLLGEPSPLPPGLHGKGTRADGGDVAALAKRLADVGKTLDELQADLPRLQGIRYNLWALRIIYRAESSPNWDALLGKIDVGLLHPTTNALYSSTYDKLIKDNSDTQARILIVQNILNSTKIPLRAF